MSSKPNSEIGEELTHDQLVPKTVYVLIGTHKPERAITLWYVGKFCGYAEFLSAMEGGRNHMLLKVNDKGQLFDSLNHRIAVHKYLGEV